MVNKPIKRRVLKIKFYFCRKIIKTKMKYLFSDQKKSKLKNHIYAVTMKTVLKREFF